MKTSKSEEHSETSGAGSRKRYLFPHFSDDYVDELEGLLKLSYPYGVRTSDGQFRMAHSRREHPILATVSVDGQSYRLRQLDRHLLFRNLYSPPDSDMLFLPDTTPSEFAETFKRRPPGRCVLDTESDYYRDYDLNFYLFFDHDGTGFAIHANVVYDQKRSLRVIDHEQVDLRWDDFEGAAEILTAPFGEIYDVCTEFFRERVNPHLRMPILFDEDYTLVPLAWQSGSEEDLRCLTRAICLTEPELFNAEEPITAIYRTGMEGRRGGFLRVERGRRWDGDHYNSRRLMALGDLIFRLNPCIGSEWRDRSSDYNSHRQLQRSALRVRVEIEPGSAHEKAEALLTLVDWLDDKLYDPQKRARFGLPPRAVP